MDTEYILGPNGELYHWGIKGMKWGQRRYQNKDGSLTPAGKKRYEKEVARLKEREKTIKGQERAKARQAKLDAKKAELDEREKALIGGKSSSTKTKVSSEPAKKKSISEMTDEELRAETSRMQAEANYMNAQKNLAALTPQKVNRGEKFVKGLMDAAVPKISNALADVASNYVKKKIGEALGLEKKDIENVYDKAKKEAEYWKNLNTATQQKKQYERGQQDERDVAKKAAEGRKADKQAEVDKKASEKQAKQERKAAEKKEKQREREAKKAAENYVKNIAEEQEAILRDIDTQGWQQYDKWLRENGYDFLDRKGS